MRFYYHCDEFVVVENILTTSPVLISRKHSPRIPRAAFESINRIASQIFGQHYVLEPSGGLCRGHYTIRACQLEG